jgi:DNA uptake protein ComE-like DNA-binding protein
MSKGRVAGYTRGMSGGDWGNGEGVPEEEAMMTLRKLMEAKGLRARNSNLSNKATMKHDTWKTGIWSGTASFLFCSAILIIPAGAQELPEGPGRAPLEMVCTQCHTLDRVTGLKRNREEWRATVDKMAAKGALGSEQDFDAIVTYLAKNFGAEQANPAAPAVMPEGEGKQVILKNCVGCHQPDRFTKYHHTKDEWQAILARMGPRANASSQDVDIIFNYPSVNFPKIEDATKVNVNKGSAQDIETRLGFTAKEAEAIVVYLNEHGDFRDWGEMLVIYGVDGKKVDAVHERMSF